MAVWVDEGEREAGHTPMELSLSPGHHSVQMEANDELSAVGEQTVEGGRSYRFVVVLPGDADPIERDAAAVAPRDVVVAHREALDACGVLADPSTELGFAFNPAGVVEMAQAFGPGTNESLDCAIDELVTWRIPASAEGGYSVFAASLADDALPHEPTARARTHD